MRREAVLTQADMLKIHGKAGMVTWLADNGFDLEAPITTYMDTEGNRVFFQITDEEEATDERTTSEAPAELG